MDNEEEAQQTDVRGIDEHPRPVQQPAGVIKKLICTPHQEKLAKQAFSREGQGDNGDEKDYADYSGNFHKGLPHDDLGEVDKKAYEALRQALLNRDKDPAFENAVKLYREDHPYGRQLINPQAGFSGDLEGPNPKDLTIPPAPKVDSVEAAAEAVELYWIREEDPRPASYHRGRAPGPAAGGAGRVSRRADGLLGRPAVPSPAAPSPCSCARAISSPGHCARPTPSGWMFTTACCWPPISTPPLMPA